MKKSVAEVIDVLQRNSPQIQNLIVAFENEKGPCVIYSHMSLGSATFLARMVDRSVDSIMNQQMTFATESAPIKPNVTRDHDDCN